MCISTPPRFGTKKSETKATLIFRNVFSYISSVQLDVAEQLDYLSSGCKLDEIFLLSSTRPDLDRLKLSRWVLEMYSFLADDGTLTDFLPSLFSLYYRRLGDCLLLPSSSDGKSCGYMLIILLLLPPSDIILSILRIFFCCFLSFSNLFMNNQLINY